MEAGEATKMPTEHQSRLEEEMDLFYGEFLAGSSRDLTDLVSILVKAQRYDLLQGEFSTGFIKGALQLFTDLLPVSERKVALKAWFVSLKLPSRAAEERKVMVDASTFQVTITNLTHCLYRFDSIQECTIDLTAYLRT